MAIFELLTPQRLEQTSGTEERVLIDTRPSADYWQGHIAGARHFDPALLSITRTDAASLARFHALLAWALSTLGLTPASKVVLIGAQNDAPTAKAAWALAYAGLRHVALLDGGLAAWRGPLVSEASRWAATNFALNPEPAYLATADDVLAAVENGDIILDARTREEFDGVRSNAGRKGRVPDAKFWDNRHELDAGGLYAAPAGIKEQTALAGAGPGTAAIVYCGGGGRAARTFVALQLAGQAAAVYPASWLEWGADPRFPIQATQP